MGRPGKTWCNSADRNGCAAGVTPAYDNAPPCSRRRSRDCAAGVRETSANKLPAAVTNDACAKHTQGCRGRPERQGLPGYGGELLWKSLIYSSVDSIDWSALDNANLSEISFQLFL